MKKQHPLFPSFKKKNNMRIVNCVECMVDMEPKADRTHGNLDHVIYICPGCNKSIKIIEVAAAAAAGIERGK